MATGRAERDPSADLRGALEPVIGKHLASITEPAKIGALLRAMDNYVGTHTPLSWAGKVAGLPLFAGVSSACL